MKKICKAWNVYYIHCVVMIQLFEKVFFYCVVSRDAERIQHLSWVYRGSDPEKSNIAHKFIVSFLKELQFGCMCGHRCTDD